MKKTYLCILKGGASEAAKVKAKRYIFFDKSTFSTDQRFCEFQVGKGEVNAKIGHQKDRSTKNGKWAVIRRSAPMGRSRSCFSQPIIK